MRATFGGGTTPESEARASDHALGESGDPRALRIAFFTDSFSPTNDGVAKVTETLGQALCARGHQVTVFTVRAPGQPRWTTRADGVRVRRYASIPAPRYAEYRIALSPWLLAPRGGGRYDVVHVHTPGFVGLAGWLAARHWEVPVIGTYHTNLTDMLRGSGRNRLSQAFFRAWGRFSRDLCLRCDLATAPTETALRGLLTPDRGPTDIETQVVPNGVDVNRFRPGIAEPDLRRRWGAGAIPLVTFLGRLTRDKGVLRFLDAVGLVQTRTPWLVVVSGQGPQRSTIEGRLATDRALRERVRFIGPVPEEEKPALLSQTDVFVLPSLSDTSSMALLEAMASGAAAVVSAQGGPYEIARRSGVGLTVSPTDPAAIAGAIEHLLDDPGERSRQSRLGRAWVLRFGSADVMANGFVRSYLALARAAPDRSRSRHSSV